MYNLVLLILFISGTQLKQAPVIETAFGLVQGVYEEDRNGAYFMYMGVPYAQAPPGNIFGDPIDPKPWSGVKSVNNPEIRCPQRDRFSQTLMGTMDCLNLNIYVPANRTELLPVYYYIHGGYFRTSSGMRYVYGPEYLIRHGIILITVTFRVGAIGFLCLKSKDIPGNTGLKDVAKGLQWVKNNIDNFGGDPDKITVGGISAGSIATEYLLLSPLTNGLFIRATLESGSITTMRALYTDNHFKQVVKLANYLGYDGQSVKESIHFLQKQDPLDIVAAAEGVDIKYYVCLEDKVNSVKPFMTDIPAQLLEKGIFKPVSLLMGFNSKEMPFSTKDILNESYSYLFNENLNGMKFTSIDERNKVAEIMRRFYIGSQPITENVRAEMEIMESHHKIAYPMFRTAMLHKKLNVSIYLYLYHYSGKRDYYKRVLKNIDVKEAIHADELGYLFNGTMWTEKVTEDDGDMIDKLTMMWCNFIKYGDPTPQVTDLLPVKWVPMVNGGRNYYLDIAKNKSLTIQIDPYRESFGFCELLYETYLPYQI